MLAALITLPHFSVSSAMSLPKSAGEPASTVPPRSASRALHLGVGEAGVDLLVELVDDLGRRVLGRANAVPGARLVARHEIRPRVGMSGSTSERVAVVTASARRLPALMYSIDESSGPKHDLHLSAEQVGKRGRRAAIRHMNHIDAGHHLEQLAGTCGAQIRLPADAMLILPGLALA